jgi:hypothetical protein
MSNINRLALAAAGLLLPGMARAAAHGPGEIFADAAPVQKLIMIGLVGATLAGVAIVIQKLAPGRHLSGGSAFISSLRLGGPIAGLLGGAYAALRMSLGVANIAYAPTLKELAPGFVEAAAVVALGLLCGAIAVVLNWSIEARIERQIARS